MKKTIFCSILILLLSLGLCACGVQGTKEDDAFKVSVKNECDGEIYGFHIEYGLGEEALGGGVCVNADGSAVKRGDTFNFSYTSKEFPEGDDDISSFNARLYVITDEEGTEQPAGEPIKLDAKFGEEKTLTVSGNETDGFLIQQGDIN